MDDFDFVDVEGDMEADIDRSSKKKDVLEEGKVLTFILYLFCLFWSLFNNLSFCHRSSIL